MLPQRVAYLDLDSNRVDIKDIPEEITRKFLGGRGINMHLLYRHAGPETVPLSPQNPLIIGPGMLTGLKGISASRCNVSGKSPETGLLGDANIGGYFGAFMKRTGIDFLVVTGAAKDPAYIYMDESGISIKDAADLWGKDAIESNEILQERHGDSSQAMSIGTAGENLVRFACIINRRKNAAARTGMGCLMGSKKIKAIVVSGGKAIEPADKAAFTALTKDLQTKLNEEPLVGLLRDFGSMFLFILINRRIGMGRAYNGLAAKFTDNRDVSPQVVRDKYYQGKSGCFSCPVNCQHEYKVGDIINEGPEYTILGSFGPVLGIGDVETVLRINELLNRYGMDASSTANIIAWAIELFEQGIIDDNDTGGLKLGWGDGAAVTELIHRIAARDGFGNILADGAKEAVARLGGDTGSRMMWAKYLPQSDPVDLRYFPAYALGNSVASRGSDHLRARPTWEAYRLPEETMRGIYGGDVDPDPHGYRGKGRVIWWREAYHSLFDALGICKQIAMHCGPGVYDFKLLAELIRCATGLEMTPDELFAVGERIATLERMFIVREGVGRQDDFPPQRYFEPLVRQNGLKPEDRDIKLDRARYEGMLDEYYQLHGWDREGRPLEETVTRLGIAQ